VNIFSLVKKTDFLYKAKVDVCFVMRKKTSNVGGSEHWSSFAYRLLPWNSSNYWTL